MPQKTELKPYPFLKTHKHPRTVNGMPWKKYTEYIFAGMCGLCGMPDGMHQGFCRRFKEWRSKWKPKLQNMTF